MNIKYTLKCNSNCKKKKVKVILYFNFTAKVKNYEINENPKLAYSSSKYY